MNLIHYNLKKSKKLIFDNINKKIYNSINNFNKNNSFENETNKQYRLDAFGNIISKKCKSHHVSFIDQISSQKLVEFCQMENNEPIVIEKKIFSTCRSCILF